MSCQSFEFIFKEQRIILVMEFTSVFAFIFWREISVSQCIWHNISENCNCLLSIMVNTLYVSELQNTQWVLLHLFVLQFSQETFMYKCTIKNTLQGSERQNDLFFVDDKDCRNDVRFLMIARNWSGLVVMIVNIH